MQRDQIHRVFGKKPVHRGPFGRSLVRAPLAILRSTCDECGLHNRCKGGTEIKLPCGHNESRFRQRVKTLDGAHDEVSEQAFYFTGGIAEVLAAAKKTQAP